MLTIALLLLPLAALAEVTYTYPYLIAGDKGDDVKDLQHALIELGYLDGRASGTFNAKTEQAVADFQYCMGLNVADEEVGVATSDTQYLLYTIPVGTTFALNTQTGKYHLPGCSSALRMNEAYKEYTSCYAYAVEELGYSPCRVCNPDTMYDYYGTGAYEGTAVSTDYVINVSTGRFHLPGCSMVSNMRPANRMDVYESRDTLIAEGYIPCSKCNP